MKTVTSFPPNYDLIRVAFPGLPPHTRFCYGDTIYNPSGEPIPADIEYHESIHSKRQGSMPDLWWNRYLTEPSFRLEEELLAYRAQYQYARNAGVRGAMLDWLLDALARALSTGYGLELSHGEARCSIKQ
jgi:hypothetical protein